MRHLAGSSASCRRALGLTLSRYDALGSLRFGFRPDGPALGKSCARKMGHSETGWIPPAVLQCLDQDLLGTITAQYRNSSRSIPAAMQTGRIISIDHYQAIATTIRSGRGA